VKKYTYIKKVRAQANTLLHVFRISFKDRLTEHIEYFKHIRKKRREEERREEKRREEERREEKRREERERERANMLDKM